MHNESHQTWVTDGSEVFFFATIASVESYPTELFQVHQGLLLFQETEEGSSVISLLSS